MSKVLKPLLIVAAIAVNVIPGIGQLASLGLLSATAATTITVVTGLGIAAGLSMASSALIKTPKIPLGNLDRLNASIVPGAYRTMVLGRTAMGTDIRYTEPYGEDDEYVDYIIGTACHRVNSIEEIWIEDRLAWSSTGGVQSAFTGYLTVNTRLEGSAVNTISINLGIKWASTRRLTGCAYVHLKVKRTGNSKKAESPFAGGLAGRITIIGEGMSLYDPRQDGTVGGTGGMAADDQASWAFTDIGNNTALQILGYLLGWRINDQLSVGCGVPPSRIDMESFIVAANLCDEDVAISAGGTEPRYRSAMVVSEGDEPGQALATMLSACNGRLRDDGGRLSLAVMHNDLAAASLDPGLTDDDVLGSFIWDPDPELNDSYNVVRGKYIDSSPAALYQPVDYPEVSLASVDGIERVLTLNLLTVESASQAQRLAKQALQRKQYERRFTATFTNRAWKYRVGDVVPLTFSALAFEDKLFRVESITYAYDGSCQLSLTEENADIYAWDASDAAAIVAADPNEYDPLRHPFILGIAEVQASADEALAAIDIITADNILDRSEKPEVVKQYNALIFEQGGIDTQATAFGITTEKTTYDTAISALTTYLTGLSPAYNSYTTDTAITRATFITKFTDAYTARTVLLNKMSAVAKANADSALSQITTIVADNVLDKSEKPEIVRQYNAILAEQSGIDTQATNYSITTEKSSYDTAVSALTSYLTGLSPAYNSYTTDTTIVRATFITKFNDVFTARQALLNKIAELASNKRNVTGGGNRVPFSKFEAGWASYWGNLFNPSGIVTGLTTGTYLNRRYLQMGISASGGSQTASIGQLTLGLFPVTAGERLAVQTALESTGSMGGAISLVIHYYNSAGSNFSTPTVASFSGLKSWATLLGDFVTVPAGAVRAQLELYFTSTGSGAGSVTMIEPMVTQASQDQTILPAYSPGPNAVDGATYGTPDGAPIGSGSVTGADVAATVNSGGGGVAGNKVGTTSVVVGALSARAAAKLGSAVIGSGGSQYLLSTTLALSAGDKVVVTALGAQNYYLGVPDWEFHVQVNGTDDGMASSGGATIYQSVVAAGTLFEAPSSTNYTFRIRWYAGGVELHLEDAILIMDVVKRSS